MVVVRGRGDGWLTNFLSLTLESSVHFVWKGCLKKLKSFIRGAWVTADISSSRWISTCLVPVTKAVTAARTYSQRYEEECGTEKLNLAPSRWTITLVITKASAIRVVLVLGTTECQDSMEERFSQQITSVLETGSLNGKYYWKYQLSRIDA